MTSSQQACPTSHQAEDIHPHRMIEKGQWREALVFLAENEKGLDIEERVLRCFLVWFFQPECRHEVAQEAEVLLGHLEGRSDIWQVREHRALSMVLAALTGGTRIEARWNAVNKAYNMISHKHRRQEGTITQFDYLIGWFVCLNALQTYVATAKPRAKTMRLLSADLKKFSQLAKSSIEQEEIIAQVNLSEKELASSLKSLQESC